MLYNGILLKVVVNDCGLSVPECACSTASVYSLCKDSPLHLLGLIADVLYNTLRNNQWCSVWLSCLAADLSWQGKQSWMKHFDEAKKNPWWRLSSAPIPISQGVCPLFLGWNCRVTLRPTAWRGDAESTPTLPTHWLCLSGLYSNLSDNMKPCDPFVQIVIAVSVFGRFPWEIQKEWRNRLKGLVSNNVGTGMFHTHTPTHPHTLKLLMSWISSDPVCWEDMEGLHTAPLNTAAQWAECGPPTYQ